MDFEGYTSEGDRKNRDILYVDLLWFAYEWEYIKCNSLVILPFEERPWNHSYIRYGMLIDADIKREKYDSINILTTYSAAGLFA